MEAKVKRGIVWLHAEMKVDQQKGVRKSALIFGKGMTTGGGSVGRKKIDSGNTQKYVVSAGISSPVAIREKKGKISEQMEQWGIKVV